MRRILRRPPLRRAADHWAAPSCRKRGKAVPHSSPRDQRPRFRWSCPLRVPYFSGNGDRVMTAGIRLRIQHCIRVHSSRWCRRVRKSRVDVVVTDGGRCYQLHAAAFEQCRRTFIDAAYDERIGIPNRCGVERSGIQINHICFRVLLFLWNGMELSATIFSLIVSVL